MPLDVFCDFIYLIVTENMDAKERKDFDAKLAEANESAKTQEDAGREERRLMAMRFGG